jgi:hypothetical protein
MKTLWYVATDAALTARKEVRTSNNPKTELVASCFDQRRYIRLSALRQENPSLASRSAISEAILFM